MSKDTNSPDQQKSVSAAFNQLVEQVQNHMHWDLDKTLFWFDTKNPNLGETTPRNYFERRPEKCIKWILSLIDENKKEDR